MPSGILNPTATCVVGNGVVLHLPGLFEEIEGLKKKGVSVDGRLKISDRAHLLFDLHKEMDGLREAELAGTGKQIGTTKRGIGPAYSSKATRNGLRVCDLSNMATFGDKLRKLAMDGKKRFGEGFQYDVDADIAKYHQFAEAVAPFVVDTVDLIHTAHEEGKRILIEGANATMLDLDFGTYPYVTSSNPSIGGIATGLGLPPTKYNAIIGVVGACDGTLGAPGQGGGQPPGAGRLGRVCACLGGGGWVDGAVGGWVGVGGKCGGVERVLRGRPGGLGGSRRQILIAVAFQANLTRPHPPAPIHARTALRCTGLDGTHPHAGGTPAPCRLLATPCTTSRPAAPPRPAPQVKAYTTRVGAGPYPTEIFGPLAEDLREVGREYGTTTGRPRRIGWMDVVALRYTCKINGLTHLNITKLDVLDGQAEIKVRFS